MKKLFLFLLITTYSFSLTIDIWRTGMSTEEALQTAEHFDYEIYYNKNKNIISYHSKLLNKNSKIELYFSNKHNVLFQIKNTISQLSKKNVLFIFNSIENKYNKKLIKKGEYSFLRINKKNLIRVKASSLFSTTHYFLTIDYVDFNYMEKKVENTHIDMSKI